MGSCGWQHPTNFDERFFTSFFKTFENNFHERIDAYKWSGRLAVWAKWAAAGGSTRRISMKDFSLSSSKLLKTMFKKQLWLIGNRAGWLWQSNGQLRVEAPDEFQ